MFIKNALKYYATFTQCIYERKSEHNVIQSQLSQPALELVANELFLLNVSNK